MQSPEPPTSAVAQKNELGSRTTRQEWKERAAVKDEGGGAVATRGVERRARNAEKIETE